MIKVFQLRKINRWKIKKLENKKTGKFKLTLSMRTEPLRERIDRLLQSRKVILNYEYSVTFVPTKSKMWNRVLPYLAQDLARTTPNIKF